MKDPNVKVEKARELIANIRREMEAADRALVPPEVSTARIEEFVQHLAAKFEASTSPQFFLMREYGGIRTFSLTGNELVDGFVAWLIGDRLIEVIQQKVDDRRAVLGGGEMTDAQVGALRDDCKRRLFEAEVAEERAIVEAEAAGAVVVRRRDADPKAILAA